MRVRAVASSSPLGNIATFSAVAAIVIKLMPSPWFPEGLTFCSMLETRFSVIAAACCQDEILLSKAPLMSAPAAMFVVLVVIEVEKETVIELFRQRYRVADADAELKEKLNSSPSVSSLSSNRIRQNYSDLANPSIFSRETLSRSAKATIKSKTASETVAKM